MLHVYLYAVVKPMLWLNLDAVGTPSVCYDCVKHYAGQTSGHAIETHAGASTKIKKI